MKTGVMDIKGPNAFSSHIELQKQNLHVKYAPKASAFQNGCHVSKQECSKWSARVPRLNVKKKKIVMTLLYPSDSTVVSSTQIYRSKWNSKIDKNNQKIHAAVFWQHTRTHTRTHTRLTALFPGLPGWAGTRKVKPIWILLKQETVSGSGISWATCKSASRSRQITTPAPHHSKVFYRPDALPAAQPTASKHWRQKDTAKLQKIRQRLNDDNLSSLINNL